MEEYERRQRREREKYERQQVQVVDREVSLFPEPRRIDPSEGDDHIIAKLGEYSKVKVFIDQNTVGISSSGHRAHMLPNSSMMPGMSSGRLPPTQQQPHQPHHYPPQQQQSRQPYTKQADNKPPYNGRGGYPGQPVKNDLRSSSGMAPPKGPPTMSSSSSLSSSASMLQPPASTNMPNGRQSATDKMVGGGGVGVGSAASSSASSSTSSFLAPLGPPTSTSTTHNGRFSQPLIPKMRQKPLPSENDITQILSEITQTFRAPPPLTEIAATPRTTIVENYNLNGPNKHKYSFDPIGPITPLAPLDPFPSMPLAIQPISALPEPAPAAAPTIAPVPAAPSRPKESIVKPLKSEKPVPALEKLNNSTLEHDLELSESDDERKKHVSSPPNSSESSPSDSSDSGSEDGEQQPHKQPSQQLLQQQRLHGVATAANNTNNKKKLSQTITASGGNTISGILSGSTGSCSGSAPGSTSSSNKTPSPTDSNKWNLSRYFNKAATQQTQNDASPSSASANVGVPMMLPGGAQIIPEPTPTTSLPAPTAVLTKVKNEAIADDEADADDDDDDDDIVAPRSSSVTHANVSPSSAALDAFRHPAAFAASRNKPELSVTPLSPLMKHKHLDEIKKESDTLFPHPMTMKGMPAPPTQQQQVPMLNAAEFVAIPTSQIKHESALASSTAPSLIAGGSTSVTPYNKRSPVPTAHHAHSDDKHLAPALRKHAEQYMALDVLSGLSSDTNSSDINEMVTLPVPGPGGTLQIPGVPAAITALPRSPPELQQKPQMLPNALTVTPINRLSPPPKYKNASPATNLPLAGAAQRAKKPRKKLKQLPQAAGLIESSDEEGEYNSSSAASKSVSPAATGSVKAMPLDAATLAAATTAAAKKGRGRPRKPTPSQSGNISSASSTTTSKGPTLTAKKDVAASPAGSNKKPAARRKVARQNSGSNATSSTSSTPQVTPTKAHAHQANAAQKPQPNKQRTQVKSNEYVASSEDSSSSSSSYSKSSSSSSDSEDGSASASSIDELKRQRLAADAAAVANAALVPPTRRIVKQLNKRKTSLDDVAPTALVAAGVTTVGAKKSRKDAASSSSCSSEESSSEEYVLRSAAKEASDLANTGGAGMPHGQPHRLSPLKTASSRSRVSSSCSSSTTGSISSSSSSSGDDHSDSDGARKENKKLRRDKPKSDKNKINTLSRIFNPKEGGAKKQGQVVIIDQSDELLAKEQHQHQLQQQQQQQQKHFSPNAAFKSLSSSNQQEIGNNNSSSSMATAATTISTTTMITTTTSTPNSHSNSSAHDVTASSAFASTTTTTASSQSPRLTPSSSSSTMHMKSSPRHPLVATQQQHHITAKRTPDRSSSSAERKLHQRIKTPTRVNTPSRTPTPTQHMNATTTVGAYPSLICKIELSRLRRIPPQSPHVIAASPRGRAVGHLTPTSTGAGRTPIYDHESILHADLQATQLRLKPPISGSGRHTPTIADPAKLRLELDASSNGRLSSRSPKDLAPPNGYTSRGSGGSGAASPASTKLLTGVKHEQIIKYEPDTDGADAAAAAFCPDTKFKSGSSVVKQELLVLKQDFKPMSVAPTTPTDKQLLVSQNSPSLIADIGASKIRRKRSSSSSSSPYKEKKRKKDKDERGSKDKDSPVMTTVTTKDKEKDRERGEKIQNNRGGSGGVLPTAADVGLGAGAMPNYMQPTPLQQQQQLPPTNHERLAMDKQQQALNARVASPVAPAHLQNSIAASAAAAHMPPPATTIAPSEKLIASLVPASANDAPAQQMPNAVPSPPTPAQPQVIYRSYFERDEDALGDDFSKNTKFLEEAVNRKHAADREQNTFNQVTLYLEAVVYFLLSGAAMEQHRVSEDAAWTMYKDTLALIKFISSKFRHLQVSSSNGQHETHNKVAILSLRCQSLISLKLYKMKRNFCRTVMGACSDFFKGKANIVNGNTPSSISPSNSLCSQGSGSNTPPGKIVPQDVHTALFQQNQFFNYLTSSHDLWDQADGMVRKGSHTDFFIALDHENGPLTLHSTMLEVFKYVQAGLKKLKDEMSIQ